MKCIILFILRYAQFHILGGLVVLSGFSPVDTHLRGINILQEETFYEFSSQGIKVFLPPSSAGTTIPPCTEKVCWVGGKGTTLYALGFPKKVERTRGRSTESSTLQNVWTLVEGGKWALLGTLEPDLAHSLALVPLDGDRFFLVSSYGFFQRDEYVAPCSIARLHPDTGVIRFETLVELDFEGPPLRLNARRPAIIPGSTMAKKYNKYHIFKTMQLSDTFPLRQVRDHFILWSDHFGWFWVFDSQGKLQRRACLVKDLTEEDIPRRWDYEWAVLAAQPTPSGNLLVVARSREAVLNARKSHPNLSSDAVQSSLNNRFAQEDYPEAEWWELDTESGAFSRAATPDAAPRHLLEAGSEGAYRFVVLGDGRLLFPDFHPKRK